MPMLNTDTMHERIYHVFDMAWAAFGFDPHMKDPGFHDVTCYLGAQG